MMNSNNEQQQTQLSAFKFFFPPSMPCLILTSSSHLSLCYHSTMATMAVAKLLRDCKNCK